MISWRGKKIIFGNMPRSDIFVFDEASEGPLKDTVLSGHPYRVVHVRIPRYYVSVRLGLTFLKNFIRFHALHGWKNEKKRRAVLSKSFLYYLSLIQCARPKVVMTFIDTNHLFFLLKEYYDSALFIAVQNGSRWKPDVLESARIIDIHRSLYFCFGQYDIDLYRDCGHDTRNFRPVGSVKAEYYRHMLSANDNRAHHHICLVSQFREQMLENGGTHDLAGAFIRLTEYLAKFAEMSPDYTICIACCSDGDREVDFFRNYFTRDVIFRNDREKLTTYGHMARSELILSVYSTAALEAFGWGKKVLLCNYTGMDSYGFPLPEECVATRLDYGVFERKVLTLLKMPQSDYEKKHFDYFKYFMNYNPTVPSHHFIRTEMEAYLCGLAEMEDRAPVGQDQGIGLKV